MALVNLGKSGASEPIQTIWVYKHFLVTRPLVKQTDMIKCCARVSWPYANLVVGHQLIYNHAKIL